MAEKTFEQEFRGYWRERDSRGLPTYSGIYIVQGYSHDPDRRTVSINNLIYIGEADNICEKVRNHEKKMIWKKQLAPGQQLCYSCTPADKEERERIVAALIRANQPVANQDYRGAFPFDTTRVYLNGDYSPLKKKIVTRKD